MRCPFCVLRKWGFTMNFIQYIKQAWKAGTSGGTPLSPDRLNHIEDGIKNNNNMISELNNNITTIVPSTYDDGSVFQKDFLNVSLSDKYYTLNLAHYFKISSGTSSQYKNLPSSAWTNTDVYGLRKVFFFEKSIVGIEVIEFFPVPGERYCNMYIGANSKYWTGWKAYLPV